MAIKCIDICDNIDATLVSMMGVNLGDIELQSWRQHQALILAMMMRVNMFSDDGC